MSRLISVSDDVYETLSELKGKESFSTAIRELIAKKSNKDKILSFFGKGGIEEKTVRDLRSDWSSWSEKYA